MRNGSVRAVGLSLGLGLGLLFAQVAVAVVPLAGVAPEIRRGHDFHPRELLVKFRPTVDAELAGAMIRAAGASEVRAFRRPRQLASSEVDRWRLVRTESEAARAALHRAFAAHPLVERVELNHVVRAQLTPGDPGFGLLWGLHNTGQSGGTPDADIDAPETWDLTRGAADVVVAVIDTGVAYTHPDLAANAWINAGEVPGNGVDDDGNGYIDDVYGYDFYNFDADPFDDHGHGTHVAGTIAAVGDNGVGVVGVTWHSRVMALKFLGFDGSGYESGAIDAILYAADMGARVMNNSWGGGPYSPALEDAIRAADEAGALFVAAAGNDSTDNDALPFYPAGYALPNVIAVAATDASDALAWFSNYGAVSVDLGAPGDLIYSTVPSVGDWCCSDPSGYFYLSGTSMATPHASGAAALAFAYFPGIGHHAVRDRVLYGSDALAALADRTLTGGRLNAYRALETDTVVPAAVTDLAVTETGGHRIVLAWTATGDDGNDGRASFYDLRYALTPIDAASFAQAMPAVGLPRPGVAGTIEQFTLTGLDPAATYYFALQVGDNVGNRSALSNLVVGTTREVVALFRDTLEAGAGNWVVTGGDGAGGPALWHLSSHRSFTPDMSLYYGRDDTLTYDTGFRNSGAVTSGPISLSGAREARLSVLQFLATEGDGYYDRATVEASVDDGASWTQLARVVDTGGWWARGLFDLSAYDGQTVRLRFAFDTFDALYNGYEGWVVDDVTVTGVTGLAAANVEPVAHAGRDQSARSQNLVTLDGSLSYDPDGRIARYAWRQAAGPAVVLTGADGPTPAFTAPTVKGNKQVVLTFAVRVTDHRDAQSAEDQVTVTVRR